MNILSIAWKDIQIFLKDRGGVIIAFLLPMIFIVIFSYIFSTAESEPQLITLPVVNLDPNGETSQELIEGLNRVAEIETELYAEADGLRLLEEGTIARVLIIPASFSDNVAAGTQTELRLVSGPEADASETEAMRTIVDGVGKDLSLQTQLVASFRQMGTMMGAGPDEIQVFTIERAVAQAQSQMERAKTQPLIAVEQKVPDTILREREEFNAVGLSVPGSVVLFAFITSSATALSIYTEKKLGTFRRLQAAPMSKGDLLAGKVLPGFVTVLAQIVVIFAASILLLPLIGLDRPSLGNDPVALALVSLLVGLCSACLGLLIAAIARTEGQISGIGGAALWIMGAVSGAFVPQFFLGDILGTIGKVTPQYWAISAYTDLIVRGQTLSGITTELAVLAGFTAVFFVIGLWRFRFN
jgi:ABC-2 type transport system permease protein